MMVAVNTLASFRNIYIYIYTAHQCNLVQSGYGLWITAILQQNMLCCQKLLYVQDKYTYFNIVRFFPIPSSLLVFTGVTSTLSPGLIKP